MSRIVLKDAQLNQLIPRYKRIQNQMSELAHEINQIINRLEPDLQTAMDIDLRLCSALRNLQNCEEKAGMLISQIHTAVEHFDAADRRVIQMSNALIYEFKQVLHQIKTNTVSNAPVSKEILADKEVLEKLFGVKGQLDSTKLSYIAEVSGLQKPKGG